MSARSQAVSPHARLTRALLAPALCAGLAACGWGTGSAFIEQPLSPANEPGLPQGGAQGAQAPPPGRRPSVTLEAKGHLPEDVRGQNLGLFRNTYYEFPSEAEFTSAAKGEPVTLRSATCGAIAQVPRAFFETLCVQGSGSLARGGTVSFAKRSCACAETCPRTGQKICYDALDAAKFPYGRGAAGTPIMPLVTVAADPTVLPLGTPIYIPELDGVPVPNGEPLDGCFLVEDRGSKVQGDHVDIFTGRPGITKVLNERVPSNQGVTVVTEAPKCDRLKKR